MPCTSRSSFAGNHAGSVSSTMWMPNSLLHETFQMKEIIVLLVQKAHGLTICLKWPYKRYMS